MLTKATKRAREKGEGSYSASGIPLVNTFPYRRLTNDQVVELFRVYHIQLGSSEQDQMNIIHAIQNMTRDKFEIAIQGILLRTRSIPQDQMVVVNQLDSGTTSVVSMSELGAL